MQTAYVELKISDEKLGEINERVINCVTSAVENSRERDDIFQDYSDQLNGIAPPQTEGPWKNSCQLDAPMTMKHHLSFTAYLDSTLNVEPFCHIEAVDPQDEEAAKELENALTTKARLWNLKPRLLDAGYDAGEYPVATLYVGWDRRTKKIRLNRYRITEGDQSGAIVDQKPTDVAYEAVPFVDTVMDYEGPDLRSVEPSNFYLYPPTAQHIDDAQLVIERMFLTPYDLLRGVKDLEYDTDAVDELLAVGPDWKFTETIQEANEADGTANDGEYYECFQVIGRMPLIRDDDEIDNKEFLDEDFCWLVCPDHQKVLKFGPSPYQMRPYADFNIFRIPRRRMGKCVPSFLETIQAESTANIRFTIDAANLIATPAVKVKDSRKRELGRITLSPGANVTFKDDPREIEAFNFHADLGPVIELRGYLDSEAKELMAAEGVESLPRPGSQPDRGPTATQVNMVSGSVSAKRGLFLRTFQEGMERLFLIIVTHWLQYMENPEEVSTGQGSVTITPDFLQKRFRFIPSATSDAANPQIRLTMTQMKDQVQKTYFQAIGMFPPDKWAMLYHAARRQMEELSERNIDGWIGPEPQGNDPSMILQQILQALQQGMMSGNPQAVMQSVAQILQAMGMAPQMAQMGGQQPPNAIQGRQEPVQ